MVKDGDFPCRGCILIVSNEPFMQKASNWLSYLKVRASYGQVGNDVIGNEPRFSLIYHHLEKEDLTVIRTLRGNA